MKTKNMITALMALLAAASLVSGCATAKGTSKAEKIAYIQKMRDDTLRELAISKPETRSMVRDLPGYAVFDSVGMKLLMFGSGNGYGVVVDNKSGRETYMKAAQVQVGVGMGVKKARVIVFFRTRESLDNMLNYGYSAGAQAGASAKAEDQGDSIGGRQSADLNVTIYQLTDSGAELSATVAGTKIWKDDELNP